MKWHLAVVLLLASGCKKDERLSRAELLDPDRCADCHPVQHEQWAGSMHAYASEDPVFRAMNARGQRETNGALGDFCVNCHAPMAVREGKTVDGANLDDLSPSLQGITCYFCHQVDAVEGEHNNPLVLADDDVMRGALDDPIDPGVHGVGYSALHDRHETDSAALCGSCHDIVTPKGVHIERTYAEWQDSLYSESVAGFGLTCGRCHMNGSDGVAAEFEGVEVRRIHDHSMPAVDTALTDFPGIPEQEAAIQRLLDTTVRAGLCVDEVATDATRIELTLENVAAGHSWPSGAAADRRAWVEVVAYRGADVVWTSGEVADGVSLEAGATDDTWRLHDVLVDGAGNPVHMFWDAEDYTSELLPASFPGDPTANHRIREWTVPQTGIDRVEARVRLRAMSLEFLQSLVDSGDLDPSIVDLIQTRTLAGTEISWPPLETAGTQPCPP